MADFANIIECGQFTDRAIATMGVCPNWDAAIANYVACSIRSRVQEEFGPMALRYEDGKVEEIRLAHDLGKGWRDHPEGKAFLEQKLKENRADEEAISKQFYRPLWEAQRRIAATPAPSLAATAFKAALIEAEEIWMDGEFDGDCIEIIDADLARFALPLAA